MGECEWKRLGVLGWRRERCEGWIEDWEGGMIWSFMGEENLEEIGKVIEKSK